MSIIEYLEAVMERLLTDEAVSSFQVLRVMQMGSEIFCSAK